MITRREYHENRAKRGSGSHNGPKKSSWKWIVIGIIALIVIAGIAAAFFFFSKKEENIPTPKDVTAKYFSLLNKGKYEDMYAILSKDAKSTITKKDFIEKNQNIYEGIEAVDIQIQFEEEAVTYSKDKSKAVAAYDTTMQTAAGEVKFNNEMTLIRDEEKHYKVEWDSTLIFPALADSYKVQVTNTTAKRGNILDRNQVVLAMQGVVSSVGVVPEKLPQNREESIGQIGPLLDMSSEEIQAKLDAPYIQPEHFVPLKSLSRQGTEELQAQLLQIPGVLITDAEERVYPLGASAGHLTGYVQAITAEELEEQKGKGYHAGSIIGKAGLEKAFEEQLRAKDGCTILINDGNGTTIEVVASKEPKDGEQIVVTIDAGLQQQAYQQFAGDIGTAAAMNPKTGEMLALVSAPGYDPNEFILGMSDKRWEALSQDANQPLTNRYHNAWVPGSTFKAITGAIGVDSGKLKPDENKGDVGLSWQKDASWGDYHVTTLTGYGPDVNLANAFIYSDNIYFAKAALDIGSDTMIEQFQKLGFEEKMPFELSLQPSSFGDDSKIDNEIQLADTGYGQGKLLVNPIHLLSMYSAFVNGGSMIQPVLTYKQDLVPANWKENVFTAETADLIKNDLIQVIENPQGTGAGAKLDGLLLLGKTGTAEIKASQDSADGTEPGWFICETVEDVARPIAVVGMVENVKDKGGSNYVVEKVKNIVSVY